MTKVNKRKVFENYKYRLHPLIKLGFFILINFLAFLPNFNKWRWIVIIIEMFFAFIIKLEISPFQSFLKFLLINFIPIFILFYFVEFSLISTLIIFWDYLQTMFVMILAAFIFYQMTPPRELLIALDNLFIPKPFALGITVGIIFLPMITDIVIQTKITQESRGYKFRLWNLGPILIPTILNLLDFSTNLALSLESRGYEL